MEQKTHFRRCHVCGGITEVKEKTVDHCSHCSKPFAPFFFFDEAETISLPDDRPLSESLTSRAVPEADLKTSSNYRPLIGLTVYW